MTGTKLRKAHEKVADVYSIPRRNRYCVTDALHKIHFYQTMKTNYHFQVINCLPYHCTHEQVAQYAECELRPTSPATQNLNHHNLISYD